MENLEVKKIVEALLFVSDQPITASLIENVLEEQAKEIDIESLIKEIGQEYNDRNSPFELRFIAGGWQLSSRKEFGPWIKKLYRGKTTFRLSNSALETLAIIAYKQPITRSEIESIRGVEAVGVLDTLLERKLARIVGRKEVVGRPLLYGTTSDFLHHFGLTHLSDLPSMENFAQQEAENAEASEQEDSQELPFTEGSEENSTNEEIESPSQPVTEIQDDDGESRS